MSVEKPLGQDGQIDRKPWEFRRCRLEGERASRPSKPAATGVLVNGAVFAFAFLAIAGRLVDLTALEAAGRAKVHRPRSGARAPPWTAPR
jgi:hypothetical protein